jgi:L-asparaginase
MTLPRIAVVTTGGTIDSLGVDRLDLAAYLETGRRLEPGALLEGITPELATIAEVVEVPFRRLRAHAMTDADLADLADGIRRLLDSDGAGGVGGADGSRARGFDGVVVTHGTNTLEETAWLLQLVVATERPIVITGAMRPASALAADGPLNLVNAVRVAASEHAHRLGVLVVIDDTIHAARDVAKSDTLRVHAFRDGAAGPLGWMDGDGRLTLAHLPARGWQLDGRFDQVDLRTLPRVDIVVTFQGADGALVDAAVAAGASGIVSAGSGAGYPTDREVEALERASTAGVVVVQASRVGAGRVPPTPSLMRRGWIAAGDLSPWKARILLRLALAAGITGAPALQALFDEA